MAMTPGRGHPAGTLANALRGLGRPLSSIEGPLRPGIVHRLDAGTSGAIVVCKDDGAHRRLAAEFLARRVSRRYLALVEGTPRWEEIRVDRPLARRPAPRKGFAADDAGRPAATRLRCLARAADHALVEAVPETGRSHQIRVQLAWLGHPLLGDTLYGGGDPAARRAARLGLRRPALHAASLMGIQAPLAPDFALASGLLTPVVLA
jgi:23S rRNA pseudouridine1911/1915/1917 synthase